jgi:CheY-like chemotaxis protein
VARAAFGGPPGAPRRGAPFRSDSTDLVEANSTLTVPARSSIGPAEGQEGRTVRRGSLCPGSSCGLSEFGATRETVLRILILEDDLLTALDLQGVVEGCGHQVVELCGTLADASRRIQDHLDFAFLDIDLPDGKSFALAERLESLRVPFAFVSASRRSELPAGLRHVPFIPKPYHHAAIRNSLAEVGSLATAC